MIKAILIILLCVCLYGASGMIAFWIAVLNTYLEDLVKERRKNARNNRNHKNNSHRCFDYHGTFDVGGGFGVDNRCIGDGEE